MSPPRSGRWQVTTETSLYPIDLDARLAYPTPAPEPRPGWHRSQSHP